MSFDSIFYQYFVSGIIDSNIVQDGGQACFNEIPETYHRIACFFGGVFYLLIFWVWNNSLTSEKTQRAKINPSRIEKLASYLGVVSLIFTAYCKILTKKGMFLVNPCHASLIAMVILLNLKDNTTSFARKLHTCQTGWIFGAFISLLIPHIEGLSTIEICFYYYEHLLLMPIGPLLLERRYGMLRPTLKNQFASYATIAFYQFIVLGFLSRLTKVNLNYILCHSPADPSYDLFGYHYFLFQGFNLNIISCIVRWITYGYIRLLKGKDLGIQGEKKSD